MKKPNSFVKHICDSVKLLWIASPKLFLVRISLEIVIVFIPIISSYLSKLLIDYLGTFNVNQDMREGTLTLIVVIVAMTVFSALINKVNSQFKNIHGDLIGNTISLRIIKKINELDISYFDNPNTYDEIQNAKKDSGSLANISWLFISIIRGTVSIIINGILLGSTAFYLPLIILLFNIPSFLIDKYMAKKQYTWERSRTKNNRQIGYINSILEGHRFSKDLRVFGTYDYLLEQRQAMWQIWFKEKRKIDKKRLAASVSISIIPYIPIVYTVFYIATNIMVGNLTIGDYTYYTALANQFQAGLLGIIASFNQGYESGLRLKKFDEFLAWPSRLNDDGSLELKNIKSIEFDHVDFAYPNSEFQVLRDVSFIINKNEKVALVGINGAGKSTIVKLILRLYDPDKGRIMINGVDIKEYKLANVRKAMGVVFQDFNKYLMKLNESVSITSTEHKKDKERVNIALKAADFLVDDRFKNGLETYLGKVFDEEGVELSGGQWQKLAIAQAYFKESKFMVFDEPSASLDPVAENHVFQKMVDLCKDKSAIFITHRLSCVVAADKIVLIENGTCSASGTHAELMNSSVTYAKLFNMQAEKYMALKNKKQV